MIEGFCAECRRRGTESFSRCGHILHKECLEKGSKFLCPRCDQKLSRSVEVELFLLKLKSLNLNELYTYAEKFSNYNYARSKDFVCDGDILEQLQRHGWDINDYRFGGPNLFYKACETNDLAKLNLLIEHGIDLKKYGAIGLAYTYSSIDAFDRLLKLGVEFHQEIIFETAKSGNLEMLERVVKEGAGVNLSYGYGGERPIHYGSESGSVEIFQYLIDNGADCNVLDDEGNSIVHFAAMALKGTDLLEYLTEADFDLEIQNRRKETPLSMAVIYENVEAVTFLIKNGVDINRPNSDGQTPLHICVIKGYMEIMKILLQNGANVNVKDSNGYTPLSHIAQGQWDDESSIDECGSILLDNGADVNILDNYKCSPLYNLLDDISPDLTLKFVKSNAKLNIRCERSKQTLRELIIERCPELEQALPKLRRSMLLALQKL